MEQRTKDFLGWVATIIGAVMFIISIIGIIAANV